MFPNPASNLRRKTEMREWNAMRRQAMLVATMLL
jgi:hypothetical protein